MTYTPSPIVTRKGSLEARSETSAALESYLEAVRIYELANDNQWLANGLIDVAQIFLNRGELALAKSHAERALAAAKDRPEAWQEYVHANLLLANTLEEEKDLPAAIRHAATAVRTARLVAAESFQLGQALSTHGRLLGYIGSYESSIALVGRGHRMLEKIVGPNALETLRARGNLGAAYLIAGDARRALPHLRASEEALSQILPADHRTLETARRMLAQCYLALGEVSAAYALRNIYADRDGR